MEKHGFDKPIFIIGGVRSGTTMMGDILSQHKDIAYWLEPKYIWKYQNPGANHDFRTAEDATPEIINFIRSRFANYAKKNGKSRFAEKTPSNVFRVPFIEKVFPEGLYIHLIRNGVDCSLSAEIQWTQAPKASAILRRLKPDGMSFWDLPGYLPILIKEVILKYLAPKKGSVWGQRFHGIAEYRAQHSVIETCARQWSEGLTASRAELKKIPEERVYQIKYEDILKNPAEEIKKLLTFLSLDQPESVIAYATKKVSNNKKTYSPKEQEKIKLIEPIIADEMRHYNYV